MRVPCGMWSDHCAMHAPILRLLALLLVCQGGNPQDEESRRRLRGRAPLKCRPWDIMKRSSDGAPLEHYEAGAVFDIPQSCRVIALGGAKLGDTGTAAFLAVLRTRATDPEASPVAVLNLPGNNITPRGARSIADFLRDDTTIGAINLYDNWLGDEGAREICTMFLPSDQPGGGSSGNAKLFDLGLGVNRIGPLGAKAIAEALVTSTTSKVNALGLYRNELGDQGTAFLATMLSQLTAAAAHRTPPPTQLTTLFLGGNSVGDDGAVALGTALKTYPSLQTLSVEAGTFGDRGAMALAEAVQVSPSLTKVDMRTCLPTHIGCSHGKQDPETLAQSSSTTTSGRLTLAGARALQRALQSRNNDPGSPDVDIIADVDLTRPL